VTPRLRSFTSSRTLVTERPRSGSGIWQGRGWRSIAGKAGSFSWRSKLPLRRPVAIEYKVLRRWRHDLGLPSYLKHEQMPQGGWTETVAAGRIDLAATVAQICELTLSPDSRPGA